MANIYNDRDIALQATAVRLVRVSTNYISLLANYTSFDVVNGVATPSSITVTAYLNGQLKGTPTFSVVSGSSGITQSTINGNAVATLLYSSLTSNTVVLRASLTYLGLTYTADISIAGQTVKPATVLGFDVVPFGLDGVKLTWTPNIDADLAGYEIRTLDAGWGSADGIVFKGNAASCTITGTYTSLQTTWYIRAYDTSGLYSATSAQKSYVPQAPSNISAITYAYADTSLTNATVTLTWNNVAPVFGLKEYEVSYPREPDQVVTTVTTRSNMIVLPANWVGTKYFTVKVRDNLNNTSSGYTQGVVKRLPNPVSNFKAVAVDSTIQLSWTLPDKTDLPISHVIIKKGPENSTWLTATIVGTKAGEFTTDQQLSAGNIVYWIACVDTDDNESSPVACPIYVSAPPDFVFNKEFVSTLGGSSVTTVNAAKEAGYWVMPVNTTETFQSHFTSNSWTTPQAQISAKYPAYIQPGTTSATYTEIFDYGNGAALILGSSNIVVSISGQQVLGTTSIGVSVSTSADGITYTTPVSGGSTFAVNFRFVKVVVTATRGSGDGTTNIGSVYKLTGITVTLSTKLKTDAGVASIASGGTYVNFNSEFIDISSINITASGTAPRICTYSFKDEIFTCSYSIVSNLMTVTVNTGSSSGTITSHGFVAGQKVRLSSSSGIIPSGVYTISTVPSATTFTVVTSLADGSGTNNLYMYPNSMTVYVFDTNGTPQSQSISWTVRGA